jgi:hypothetical protein
MAALAQSHLIHGAAEHLCQQLNFSTRPLPTPMPVTCQGTRSIQSSTALCRLPPAVQHGAGCPSFVQADFRARNG